MLWASSSRSAVTRSDSSARRRSAASSWIASSIRLKLRARRATSSFPGTAARSVLPAPRTWSATVTSWFRPEVRRREMSHATAAPSAPASRVKRMPLRVTAERFLSTSSRPRPMRAQPTVSAVLLTTGAATSRRSESDTMVRARGSPSSIAWLGPSRRKSPTFPGSVWARTRPREETTIA